MHRLFYESSRFSAFNNQWVVKARINDCQKDPTQSSDRDMTYQVLSLMSKTNEFFLLINFLVDFKIKIPDAAQSELHCAQRPSGGYQSQTEDLRV